ncbi:adenylate/guanylate cyclase domain-containing protein [Psychrobacillus glaciei]|uniref:Adenylate/guanylate cyclase domain-containing protein n=1 Tax=Psychrobacillus glaciei TaxID=2283160 RepID=A0A5J6SIJ8_9BACI|nr:adenylate/guanylate cyclase domain-containing protein [Psychrobacillus glaciei]QFF97786.1 adenylate/guanylate cyclase domain-containing protein [Psychrobacillus glaciei]
MQKTIHFQDERIFHIPVEEMWTLLADTNHLNNFIGLFPVQFAPFSYNDGKLIRQAKATALGGVKIAWKEHTFEWERNHYYSIERVYTNGPIERALWHVILEPREEQETLLILKGEFICRNLIGKLSLKNIIIPQLKKTFQYVLEFEKNGTVDFPRPQTKQSIIVEENRLSILAVKLDGIFLNQEMSAQLMHTIRTYNEDEITSMKPYQWAETYHYNRKETVELFLLATKLGILDQEWSLMCPNCRVPKGQTSSLKHLDSTVHCDLCGVDYELNFDRYIEMRFSVNPSIRKTKRELFCVNGPMNSPHVLAQFRILPNTTKNLKIPIWGREVRLRVLKYNHLLEVSTYKTEEEVCITYRESGFTQSLVSGSSNIQIGNKTDEEIVLVIEEVEWDRFALTAREVTSLQLFRDLFAAEVLSPDQQIGVSNIAVLFTDLKGSTRLYESIGDALAYADVKKHFDYLKQHIQQNGGAVIKTIGDSVMATFTETKDAWNAAVSIQQHIQEINKQLSQDILVKIGFHSGPVIAVNANEILDYFGRTVNMAARIQQESQGNDIVMSKEVYEDLLLDTNFRVMNSSLKIETFKKHLQGLEEDSSLIRVIIDS